MKRWFLKQAGCESLSLVVQGPDTQSQCGELLLCLSLVRPARTPQHTLGAILGADLTFTLGTLTAQ